MSHVTKKEKKLVLFYRKKLKQCKSKIKNFYLKTFFRVFKT